MNTSKYTGICQVTREYVRLCGSEDVKRLVHADQVSILWSQMARLYEDEPYRGQIVFSMAVDNAFAGIATGGTPKDVRLWRTRFERWMDGGIALGCDYPPNLLSQVCGPGSPQSVEVGIIKHILQAKSALQHSRYRHTIQGSHRGRTSRGFARYMALFWEGCGLALDGETFTSLIVRVLFDSPRYTTSDVRRDYESHELEGSIPPWGHELESREWLVALADYVSQTSGENMPQLQQFLQKHASYISTDV